MLAVVLELEVVLVFAVLEVVPAAEAVSSPPTLSPALGLMPMPSGANCGCCGSVLTTFSPPLLLPLSSSSSLCFGFVASAGNVCSAVKLPTDTTNAAAIITVLVSFLLYFYDSFIVTSDAGELAFYGRGKWWH